MVNAHVGLDVGTMNLVSAVQKEGNVTIKNMRNVFLEIDVGNIGTLDLSKLSHSIIEDKVYILSEDAHNMASMFNQKVRRPMQDGLISANDLSASDILTVMVKELIGEPEEKGKSICAFSVPANPIDAPGNILYHENIFSQIISSLGFKPIAVNEALSIIYSECENTAFSGIGISYGAGMTNVCVAYKAIPILTFSVSRGGDWIDTNTGQSLGITPTRITTVKEKSLHLTNPTPTNKKREKQILQGLGFYYQNLIDYTLDNVQKKLSEVETDFPEPMPIVISGGTSLAGGFIDMVRQRLEGHEFPFDVSEVRHATDPLGAVANGNLIKSVMSS